MPLSDQNILWTSRPSHWVKANTYLGLLIAAAGMAAIGWFLPDYHAERAIPEVLQPTVDLLPLVAYGLSGAFFLWLALVAINHQYTRYVLTEDTLFTRTNFIRGHHDTVWIHLIRDIRAELPLHLRMIGLGNIVIIGLDRSHPELVLRGVRKARHIKTKLNTMARTQGAKNGVRGIDTGG